MINTVNTLIVKELASRYQVVHNCLVVNCQGVDALEANEIRRDLSAKRIHLEVVKNSLARLAFKEVGDGGLAELFSGPSAIVSGGDDPVVMAKTLMEWSKKVPALSIKGGFVEGRLVSAPEVERLSRLPSRQALYAQIATLIKSPMARLAMAVSAPLQKLYGVFNATKEKKGKESPN
ncbi:MAG: 50S ribosomal protein L10 [Candidatus Brocadiales bacterium]